MNIVGFGCGLAGRAGGVSTVPVLTSLNYPVVDVGGGQLVTIAGVNLAGATSVTMGGTSCSINSNTSTSIAFWSAIKAAGSYSVQVTTPGGASNTLSIQTFNPAAITNLTGYWRGPFAGAPWGGQVLSRNLVTDGSDPTVPDSLNGMGVAGFASASSQRLFLGSGLHISDFIGDFSTAIRETGFALVKVASAPVDPGAGARYQGGEIYGDSGAGVWSVSVVTQSGVGKLFHEVYNGSAFSSPNATIAIGSWQLAQWGYDGTNAWVRVGSGSRQNVAYTPTSGQPGLSVRTGRVGGGPSLGFFNGEMAALGFVNADYANSNLDTLRQWFESWFALTAGSLS